MADLSHSMHLATAAGAISAGSVAISAKPAEQSYYKAFHALEHQIVSLTHAGALLELMMNQQFGATASKSEVVSFEISRDDWEAVFFSMFEMTNRARDLRRDFNETCQRLHPTGTV